MGDHIDTRGPRRKKTTNEGADNLARKRRVTFKNYIRELEENLIEEDIDEQIEEGMSEGRDDSDDDLDM